MVRVDARCDAVACGVCVVEEKIRRLEQSRSADADNPAGRSYVLTLWQARWGYFFALLFALTLPLLLELWKSRLVVWAVVIVSFFPTLQYWDAQIWPNESELARRTEARRDAIELRALAERIRSSAKEAFLAPWWLSPAIAYWSGEPGIAGSSHESLPGIIDTARFSLTSDENAARELLRKKNVNWVFVYDSDRVLRNSAAILNESISPEALGRVLDRTPGRASNLLNWWRKRHGKALSS